LARPEDGEEAQAPRVARRAPREVHAGQPLEQGRHGLGRCGRLRRRRGEEGPTPRERGRMAPVGEDPEGADAHEAGGEAVQEEPVPSPVEGAAEKLLRRERDRFHAVPVRIILPPGCGESSRTEAHPPRIHADEPVIGDGHAVAVAVEALEDLCGAGERGRGSGVSGSTGSPSRVPPAAGSRDSAERWRQSTSSRDETNWANAWGGQRRWWNLPRATSARCPPSLFGRRRAHGGNGEASAGPGSVWGQRQLATEATMSPSISRGARGCPEGPAIPRGEPLRQQPR